MTPPPRLLRTNSRPDGGSLAAESADDDSDAAAPRLLHVSAGLNAAGLARQLGSAGAARVRAVSLTVDAGAEPALSWMLRQLSPQLRELRLRGADAEPAPPPLRDGLRTFGSGLLQLRVLWLVGCGLDTLDGVCALPRLRELYVACNRLCDLSVCSCLDQLQILDAEDNCVSDLGSLLFLRVCSELQRLELRGNPVADDSGQLQNWLPQLLVLNGQPTAAGERQLRRQQRPAADQLPPVRRLPAAAAAAARTSRHMCVKSPSLDSVGGTPSPMTSPSLSAESPPPLSSPVARSRLSQQSTAGSTDSSSLSSAVDSLPSIAMTQFQSPARVRGRGRGRDRRRPGTLGRSPTEPFAAPAAAAAVRASAVAPAIGKLTRKSAPREYK